MKRIGKLAGALALIAAFAAIGAGCDSAFDTAVFKINDILDSAQSASKITRTVIVKEGDEIVSKDEAVYTIGTEQAEVAYKVTSLNPDLAAEEEYLVTESTGTVSLSEVPNDFSIDAKYLTEDSYSISDTEFVCTIPDASAAQFLGQIGNETPSGVKVTAQFFDKVLSIYQIEYLLSSGRSAEITFVFDSAIE